MSESSKQEISNLDLPFANLIRELLHALPTEKRSTVMGEMSEDEFISDRVDIYLNELSAALHAGLDEIGAIEVAKSESLKDLQG